MSEHRIVIRSVRITQVLLWISACLVFVSFTRFFFKYLSKTVQYPAFLELFNMDADKNIPLFFYIILLILCSLLLTGITFIHFREKSIQKAGWMLLSLIIFTMALDKATGFHEFITRPIRKILISAVAVPVKYLIIIIALALGLAVLVILFRLLRSLPGKSQKSFLIAAGIYLSGAIVLDLIGSVFYDYSGRNNLIYDFLSILEVSLEMGGIIMFMRALIDYIADTIADINLGFGRSS